MECPKCGREIKEDEKNCPYCQYDLVNSPKIEKEEMKIYKKWCLGGLIAIVVIVVIGIAISSDNTTTTASKNTISNTNNTYNKTNTTNNTKVEKTKVAVIDFSQLSKEEIESWCATNKVKCSFSEVYSDDIEKGLFVSQSTKADGTVYEGDKITITYSLGKEPTLGQKNALSKAKSYLAYSSFSYKGLVKQLEYEKFSHEEATYGADNCGADWNEQCAKKAKSYMEYSSFSRSGLISQLEYEGFTKQQAEYGASSVGY